ncbi:MAG: SdrD B-like domain-containing protein, partial [Gemmatimonadota bacterium]
PIGTPGVVSVRVYVDADGDGIFSEDDQPVAGVGVILTSSSGATSGANTDVNGLATISDVAPGAYRATLTGTLPTGAVLATASTATVVVPFAGGVVTPQFRFAYNPGTISGVLYRDDNSNGAFEAGVDTPAPGMTVTLFAGTDASQAPMATTVTGAGGDFKFATLRPGLYTVLVTPIPTIQIVGGNARTITVGAATAVPAPIRFTGNLLTPIAAARTAGAGATVAFVGVATQNAALFANNNLYVQDATGGVLVFGAATAGIQAGDTVRVIGVITIFNGEVEVAGTGLSVTKVGTGAVPAPRAITVAQLLTGQFLGQLVTTASVTVRSVVTTSGTAYNVNVQGNTPADTFQIRITNTNNIPIPSTFWQVGRRYDVTGVDAIFNGLHQLKARSAADVVVGATITIASARTHPAGDTVTVEGVLYLGTGVLTQLTATNLNAYVQDASGGALIFNIPTGSVFNAGDSVRVKGLVAFFSGEYEIARFTATSPPVIDKLGTGTIPAPRTTTGAELASKAFDGLFIKMIQQQVVSVSTPNAAGAYNVVTTSLDGTSVTVRIDQSTVGIPNTSWVVGSKYDVSGAALNFVSGSTTTPELKPRSLADVVLHP